MDSEANCDEMDYEGSADMETTTAPITGEILVQTFTEPLCENIWRRQAMPRTPVTERREIITYSECK